MLLSCNVHVDVNRKHNEEKRTIKVVQRVDSAKERLIVETRTKNKYEKVFGQCDQENVQQLLLRRRRV
jgi:hypothetical protein